MPHPPASAPASDAVVDAGARALSPERPPFPAVEELLAHRPPMRLVDRVLEELPGGLSCQTRIGPDFVFLRDGRVDIAVCLELIAQTVACYSGLADRRKGLTPRGGLFVGCRDARFHAGEIRQDDELRIDVHQEWVREPAASFRGEVTRGAETLATAVISVVSGIDLATVLEGGMDV